MNASTTSTGLSSAINLGPHEGGTLRRTLVPLQSCKAQAA